MSSREVRLLLVDDDPSAIQIMSRMLAQYPVNGSPHPVKSHFGSHARRLRISSCWMSTFLA